MMEDIVENIGNEFIKSVMRDLPLPWDCRDDKRLLAALVYWFENCEKLKWDDVERAVHTKEERAGYRAICEARWKRYCDEANKRFPSRHFDPANSMDASRAFALILNPLVDA